MIKFRKRGDRSLIQQHFDKDKITITKAGVTYNVYDAIQAANVDTDINEVMKKYHCMPEEAAEFMKRKGGLQGIYGEFAELQEKAKTMPDIINIKKYADEMFANLPSEIREKYGNDLEEWFKDLSQKTATNEEDKQLKEQGVKENEHQ